MASDATHEAADRALSTVARKLDKTLSVEYTVNDLVTEASDPTNLALMYAGKRRLGLRESNALILLCHFIQAGALICSGDWGVLSPVPLACFYTMYYHFTCFCM